MRAATVGALDRHRRGEVVIVHHDDEALMTLAVAFSDGPYEITVTDAADTLVRARHLVTRHPVAMIVALRGDELLPDVRSLLTISKDTRFLFLAPRVPPHAALARVVKEHGSAILGRYEPLVLIVATVVGLLAGPAPALGGRNG